MRKMQSKSGKTTVKVTKHIILQNYWEYYVVDDDEMQFEKNSDIQFAYAIGIAKEFGTISMSEMKPYIVSETTDLDDVAPAPDWRWIDE
tara:strand:+ start:2977 stop:3243 length:267 start_codon:yes stop_codon:yes gene_type:complete